MGTIEIPRNFPLLDIGDDYIFGTVVDELDIPHLVAFRLKREAKMETAR